MAKQSLLWTTLPNGYSDDGKSLRVSVLLSPRLDAEGDPQQLGTFGDFVDWPDTLARARFVIHFGADSVAIAGNDLVSKNRVDDRLGAPDSNVWTALLPDTTFVQGYKFRDLSTHQVLSFQAANMDNLVRNLYARLASSAQDHLPKASAIIGDPFWQQLLDVVRRNDSDDRFVDYKRGLRNPRAQFAAFSNGEFNHLTGLARDVALFQLFHTPPSTPKIEKYAAPRDDAQARAQWLTYERTPLPDANSFKDQIDFHQIVTAMNQYPALLRLLGLVVDLLIDKTSFTASPNAPLWAKVELPPGSPEVRRDPDVSPRTRTLLDASLFQPVPRGNPGQGDYSVANGLLELDPKLFNLVQTDVDGAGMKVMNFARTLVLLRDSPDTQLDPVSKHEREVGAPALRNSGLMLIHNSRAGMLKNSFDRQKKYNDTAEAIQSGVPKPPPRLHAEDLVRGFRIDIWDDVTRRWHSLCRREASYDINKGDKVISVPEEEGTVRLAATTSSDPTSNPDLVWLHETFVAWTGWSLCAPAPGRTISHREDDHTDPVTDSEAEVPPGLRLESAFKALAGSLPRLRYGRKYWIRARVVDLAGNSLTLAPRDFGLEQSKKNARPYYRYDPISAPAIALFKATGGAVEAPAEGESMERVAVRSFNDTPVDNTIITSQRARRIAVPARTTQKESEHHGMLDHGGIVDPSFFAMLAAKDNSLAEETILTAGPLAEGPPVEVGFAVMQDGEPLPYLPDPLAIEVAARIFDHSGFPSNRIIRIPLYDGAVWPDAQPFKIELFEDPADKPRFDKATRTLLVPLPKAERVTLRLSVKPNRDALRLLGVWNWLTPAQQNKPEPVVLNGQPATLESIALNGQHWMLTPWRNIELVHAVQRPLITPEILKHNVNRDFLATNALPSFIVTCSVKSTNHLDVLAQWNEPAEEVNQPAGANRARTDHAFAVKITDDKSYAGGHEYELLGPDLIRAGGLFHDRIQRKSHEFNDTRYRRIEYWFDATTKFREFMPPGVLTEVVDGKTAPTDRNIKVTGDKLRTWIPSSAPPPAPEVLYIVPTFGWVRSFDQPNKSSWRRGGGLRVYLNRPWNVSGYGEMLAVVLPSNSFTGDPGKDPSSQPLKNFVTQWGNDPIWLSSFVSGVAPKRSNFPLARAAGDPAGKWLPSFAPAEEADQPPGPFQTTGLRHPELKQATPQTLIEIAPHDVFYDEERQLWYCDIEVNWGAAYYPFIRLALARYQPVSHPNAYLSNIVLADFMPLIPDRWLNVTQTIEPRTRYISVFGPTYTDSSPHTEAKNAPAMSVKLIDGTFINLQAPSLASSSVIDVWVERFDPSWGEDFGWRREPDAIIQRGTRVLGKVGTISARNVSPAAQKARATKLVREREFEAVIQEGLIDKIFRTPAMWDGSVTLPQKPGVSTRYRLAIAEYEEYLVDDATPYDKIPTKKDRRLVFIEYVELE